jgi:hypothetical protein
VRWLSNLSRGLDLLTRFDDALEWPDDPLLDDDADLGAPSWHSEALGAADTARWAA